MKIVFNLLLFLGSLGLIYLLVESIRKPIDFKETTDARELVVRARLLQVAEMQKMHKALHQEYANDFDSLKIALTNDSFYIERVIGDPYDTTQVVEVKIIAFAAKDSLFSYFKKNKIETSVDDFFTELRKVPFSTKNAEFYIKKSTAIVEGTDSLMAPTFEVGTTLITYLEEFDSAGYVIYNPLYDPANTVRKVGDLYKPSTSGNW